jgi:predicted esterase YcpF (UPF0227 family)
VGLFPHFEHWAQQPEKAQFRDDPRPAMLIYLHGLNGSGQSHKAAVLSDRLAPYRVLTPPYPAHRPDAAITKLTGLFRERIGERPFVVGSSMGGFYGQYLARQFSFSHLFLINPALTPWSLLHAYEGQSQTTAYGDTYVIDKDLIESTRRYGVANPCDGIPTTLFLDKGDEVIDYRIAETLYRQCGRLRIFDDGDHSFQHLEEAISVIRTEIAEHE